MKTRLRSGTDRTDWARIRSTTQDDLEAAIAGDPDEAGLEIDWSTLQAGAPDMPKEPISIRLDPKVLSFFRDGGPGYQSRINAVLRDYVEQMEARKR